MAEQWYYCPAPTCGFEFPAREMSSHKHKGYAPWQTDSQTEESNQDEATDKDDK